MRQVFRSLLLAAALPATNLHAVVTVDGTASTSAPENYVATANNTNATVGQAGSCTVSGLLARTEGGNTIHLFAEGQLNNTNFVVFLIDSDANAGTGFTTHPNGSSATSNALEYFTAFPDGGGYDLAIALRAGSGGAPTDFSATIISYDSAGAIVDELGTGASSGNPGSISVSVRGNTGNLVAGLDQGGGAGQGIEIGFPSNWLLNSFSGSMRAACFAVNGTSTVFFDSVVPQLAATGDIAIAVPGDEARLSGLAAPTWSWATLPVELDACVVE